MMLMNLIGSLKWIKEWEKSGSPQVARHQYGFKIR